jgi:hypothetical protein
MCNKRENMTKAEEFIKKLVASSLSNNPSNVPSVSGVIVAPVVLGPEHKDVVSAEVDFEKKQRVISARVSDSSE